ncbi:hypothetical protein BT96DRAFT_997991 [Gymnopus androsaceus JB14]|uniref:Uncharacterized protein n=1 Tax=Gymnopus androsaceus JB14 TaxID=1447944 RepID=A0A6A4HAA2_9AGAR|nr:hypothetical protein BT96DRAFT_997991 [Gymnopus androsaceus JB14]
MFSKAFATVSALLAISVQINARAIMTPDVALTIDTSTPIVADATTGTFIANATDFNASRSFTAEVDPDELNDDPALAPYIVVAAEFTSSEAPGAAFDPATPKGLTMKKGMGSRVAKECIEKGMLLLMTSVYEMVRFIPPLNIL